MEKYYEPDISEFYVGFEFERTVGTSDDSYYHDKIEEVHEIADVFCCEKVRVKYLDREDIESLGWVFVSPDRYLKYRKDGDEFDLFHNPENNNVWIRKALTANTDTNSTMFLGEIKNKSELKVILRQTGL